MTFLSAGAIPSWFTTRVSEPVGVLAAEPWSTLAAVAVGALVVTLFIVARALPRLAPGWVCRALGARPLGRLEAPYLRAITARLAASEGLREPRVLVVPHDQANVFVLVDESGLPAIALTQGALRSFGPEEAEAAVGAALARTADPRLHRSTVAAGVGLAASSVAGLGAVSGGQAEVRPFAWPLGTPFVLLGVALSRSLAGTPPGGSADLRGARISGRTEESARLLEHMEFTAHARPMDVSGSLSRLALVDPRGEHAPLSLSRLYPAPPPSAPRAALLRGHSLTPDGPSCAQAA